MREFGRAAGINDMGGVVRLKATVVTKETGLPRQVGRSIDVTTSVIPKRGSVLQEGDALEIRGIHVS